MKTIYQAPAVMTGAYMTTCGGCGHGLAAKLLGEIIDELGIARDLLLVLPIGCATNAWEYYQVDSFCALHGRAPAVATGIKRASPERIVVAYQGDGDLASEGMSEIIHATIRGEKLSVIFINNTIFGMTGAQMAPTTMLEQVTSTSPKGKKASDAGEPVLMAELLAQIPGCFSSERVALNNPQNIRAAKRAIKNAIVNQMNGRGLSFVEVLSPCPTGWKTAPVDAIQWIEKEIIPVYPLGVKKQPEEVRNEV